MTNPPQPRGGLTCSKCHKETTEGYFLCEKCYNAPAPAPEVLSELEERIDAIKVESGCPKLYAEGCYETIRKVKVIFDKFRRQQQGDNL